MGFATVSTGRERTARSQIDDWHRLRWVAPKPLRVVSPAELIADGTDIDSAGNNAYTVNEFGMIVTTGNQAAGDFDGLLLPVTFSIGDEWMIAFEARTFIGLQMVGLRFAGGVTGTDPSLNYVTQSSTDSYSRTGTIADSQTATAQPVNNLAWSRRWIKIRYQAANSFICSLSKDDGATWTAGSALSFTMTPTHVGPSWCTWGATSGTAMVVRFGYMAKVA